MLNGSTKGNFEYNLPFCDDWTIEVYDVEAAFLNAKQGAKMYIKVPEAMIICGFVSREEAFQIIYDPLKSMYGNVDAALRFFLLHRSILLSIGFIQSKKDPCLFFKLQDDKTLMLLSSSHVDDTLCAGRKPHVKVMLKEYQKHLNIETLGLLKKASWNVLGVLQR